MIKPISSLPPLGRTLRSFRKSNRYSLDELASLSGLSKSHVWQLENDAKTDPQLSTLVALAKVMKKPVGWLANRAAAPDAVEDKS